MQNALYSRHRVWPHLGIPMETPGVRRPYGIDIGQPTRPADQLICNPLILLPEHSYQATEEHCIMSLWGLKSGKQKGVKKKKGKENKKIICSGPRSSQDSQIFWCCGFNADWKGRLIIEMASKLPAAFGSACRVLRPTGDDYIPVRKNQLYQYARAMLRPPLFERHLVRRGTILWSRAFVLCS